MGILSRIFGSDTPPVQPTHLDERSFASEVLRSDLPVVVDFWSPGCGPCGALEPIVMDLASRYRGRVKFAEVNAAEATGLAARLGVSGTPTVLFFKGGREVERVVGFVGSRYLREVVDVELLDPPAE